MKIMADRPMFFERFVKIAASAIGALRRSARALPICAFYLDKLRFNTRFHCKVPAFIPQFPANCCCLRLDPRLLAAQFSRLFWGEQPPFASIGRGGRYSFRALRSQTPNPQRRTVSTSIQTARLKRSAFKDRIDPKLVLSGVTKTDFAGFRSRRFEFAGPARHASSFSSSR